MKWKTAGCFWPMLAGISSPEQEAKLISHLKDPKSFWRQNIFPTLAADQPGYDPSGGYWKGGVWAPTNYAIIRGLARQGHGDFAREATTRYLDEMFKLFQKTGTVWELYAPDMERHGIRNLRFGDITASLVCAPQTNPTSESVISIECSRPFTLILRKNRATKSFEIQKGTNRLNF